MDRELLLREDDIAIYKNDNGTFNVNDYKNNYISTVWDMVGYINALDCVVYDGHVDIEGVCVGNNILAYRTKQIIDACTKVMNYEKDNLSYKDMSKMNIEMLERIKKRLESRRKGNENEESSSTYSSVS